MPQEYFVQNIVNHFLTHTSFVKIRKTRNMEKVKLVNYMKILLKTGNIQTNEQLNRKEPDLITYFKLLYISLEQETMIKTTFQS